MESTAGPVDWELARRVAAKVAGREELSRSPHYATLEPDFARFTAEAEELVGATTGLHSLAGAARGRVVDRAAWVDANIASFQRLLRPVLDKLGDKMTEGKRPRLATLTRRAAGVEVGVVLGWMSTRVLGQYDLLIIEDEAPDEQDIVYYVGPNVMALERRHGFPPEEFRLWLALHECTHRAQFTGVPWLRAHFLGLVEQMVDAVDPDPGRLKEVVREIVEAKRRGDGAMPEGGLPALFATPEQRLTLNQISGMMSLLEGHGDVTMDRAGAGRVPSAERFSETLRQRRNSARGVNRIFQRLLGIDAKLAQYEAGEQFIAAVETAGGPALLDRAWERAENLPSLDEIKAPDLWIERVGGSSALDESARDEPVEVPGAVA